MGNIHLFKVFFGRRYFVQSIQLNGFLLLKVAKDALIF